MSDFTLFNRPVADQVEAIEEAFGKEIRTKLNTETGRMTWPELERHFARGVVIKVDPAQDLIDVAARVSEDDKSAVKAWMESGQVVHPSMDDARGWVDRQPEFWVVVVAPWVLIQEIVADDKS